MHCGLFWQRIRKEFPLTEGKPAMEPSFERFGEAVKRVPRLRFETREDVGPEKIWFLNSEGTELIQLQVNGW